MVSFFQSQGNSLEVAELVASIIDRFIKDSLQACYSTFGVVLLESCKAESTYQYPYWHIDGPYFQNDRNLPCRIVATLKGTGTLFSSITDDAIKYNVSQFLKTRLSFKNAKYVYFEQENIYRQKLDLIIKDCVIQEVGPYQGAIFLIGGSLDNAAFHAKPLITGDRLLKTRENPQGLLRPGMNRVN